MFPMIRQKGKYPWGKKTGKVVANPQPETPKPFRIDPPPGNFSVTVRLKTSVDNVTYDAVDDYEITVAYLCLKMGSHELYFSLANLDWFDIVRRNSESSDG